MKKITSILFAAIFGLSLFSCGGDSAEKAGAQKIDTKDVKGTIEADGASIGNTTLHNDEGEYDVPNVDYDGFGFLIAPTSKSFEEVWTAAESNLTAFGSYESIEKKENAIFYKEIVDFAGKKEEGYNFLVLIKGSDKNYLIEGEGENPLKPIMNKEDAEKAFKAALTFKPE